MYKYNIMSGVEETNGVIYPPVGEAGIIDAELVDPEVELGHDLVLWGQRYPEARERIGRVLIGNACGFDRFADGPLTLDGTQVDGVAAFLIATQAHVSGYVASTPETPVKTVEIDLEAARRDLTLILGMIRTAPQTEFHQKIVEADVAKFENRFSRYRAEGRSGLWESLKLTDKEIAAAKRPRRARYENGQEISSLRKAEEARLRAHDQSGFQPVETDEGVQDGEVARWVLSYILEVDEAFRRDQEGASDGMSAVTGSAKTRERLERLSAVKFAFVVGETGESDDNMLPGVSDPDSLKLVGLRHAIDSMWRALEKQQFVDDPDAYIRGERPAEFPDELLEMEALHTALAAKNMLLQRQGAEAGMNLLVESIARIESARVRRKESRRYGRDTSRFLALDADGYTQDEFESDVLIAGSAWRVIDRFGTSADVAEFETSTQELILDAMRRGGKGPATGNIDASAASSALSPHVRLGLSAEAYDRLAAQALELIGSEGGPIGASRDSLVRWYLETRSGSAARQTDLHGRYRDAQQRDMERLGSAQRKEDFPAQGRMLCYYGDIRLSDGAMGALEALGVTSGLYQHLDSVGNSPMINGAFRTQLEAIAEEMGIDVQVHEPFRFLPADYRCEAAHFVGRMPQHIAPRQIIAPVCPNGIATLQVESNNELVSRITQADTDLYRFAVIPSELVRFLRMNDESLSFALGHADPDWEWKDHTLAIFFNKEDGSPSDLYQELSRQALAAREIEG
jgi:hypothetical protein